MERLPQIVGETWFNSKPLTSKHIAGKVVLVDFWTYTCVNCQRTLPYLRDWWHKYKDKGFLLIGVHTPEFEFEKDPKNVRQGIRDLKVDWPVVLDSEYINWNNFRNHYWPAKYLADKNANIVYTHFGEGAYEETEKGIQQLIGDSAQEITSGEHSHGNVCFIPTPETYCGYARGHIENTEGYQHNKVADYKRPREIRIDSIALSGIFIATAEYVESSARGAELLINFRATEVNLVLHPVDTSVPVEIRLNGKPLRKEIRGKDMIATNEIRILKPAMYNLLKSKKLMEGILSVRAKKGNFQAYVFTFSGCAR